MPVESEGPLQDGEDPVRIENLGIIWQCRFDLSPLSMFRISVGFGEVSVWTNLWHDLGCAIVRLSWAK